MISIERALKQAAWADDQLFRAVAKMPPAALGATYASEAWPVGRLLHHIVTGLEWYRYVLNRTPWTDVPHPVNGEIVLQLADYVATLHAEIIEEAKLDDAIMEFEDEGEQRKAHRSTVITMAAHHSTEHRAQIAAALEIHGFAGVNLDVLDLWGYEEANG